MKVLYTVLDLFWVRQGLLCGICEMEGEKTAIPIFYTHKTSPLKSPHTRVKVMSPGVYPVARPVVLCAGPPSHELLHAVKQTVVSV